MSRPLFIFSLLFIALPAVAFAAPIAADYESLEEECQRRTSRGCCMASFRVIKENGYFLASEGGTCPDGYSPNMMRCIDSYQWCEPEETDNSVDYDALENRCREVPYSQDCCLGSVKVMRDNDYVPAQDGPGAEPCPEGFFVNAFDCVDSMSWCEPLERKR
jgi:hypothetical protein